MKEILVTKVEIEDGNFSILFPPNFMEKLKLNNGQFLIWEIDGDHITITKKLTEEKNAE